MKVLFTTSIKLIHIMDEIRGYCGPSACVLFHHFPSSSRDIASITIKINTLKQSESETFSNRNQVQHMGTCTTKI